MEPCNAQTTLLRRLSDGACMTMDALVADLDMTRRQISNSAARLLMRGYLERIEAGCYRLTAAGVAAAASGEVIKPGPWRPEGDEARSRKPGTFRQRCWTAIRMTGSFTIGEVSMVATKDDVNGAENARKYIRALRAAGFVAELSVRQKGTHVTSNGFKRFRLIRDTGPLAPVYREKVKSVHDFNTGEDVPCGKNP